MSPSPPLNMELRGSPSLMSRSMTSTVPLSGALWVCAKTSSWEAQMSK